MTRRLKYVKFTPEAIIAYLRSVSDLPPDAKVVKMGRDKETGYVVCLVASESFPEAVGVASVPEISLK
jgi:hypothetical protein